MTEPIPALLREKLDAQAGVIARWQVIALGAGLDAVLAQVRSGRWQRVGLGIYAAFTGQLSREAQLWAVVLRAGPQAVLSHETAAELDGFARRPSRLIHVTVPVAQHMVAISGAVVHRSSRLDLARHPARTPPRTRIEDTALDMTQLVPTFDDAFGWISRPCNARLTTPPLIRAAMCARPKFRWRAELDAALSTITEGVMSPLEHRWVRDVEHSHGLPTAQRQVLIILNSRPRYLDNLYKEVGIGVELDGQAYHPVDERWRDIARDNALAADGILVLRYGWADVESRACMAAVQWGEVAVTRGWTGRLRPCGPMCDVRKSALWP